MAAVFDGATCPIFNLQTKKMDGVEKSTCSTKPTDPLVSEGIHLPPPNTGYRTSQFLRSVVFVFTLMGCANTQAERDARFFMQAQD
jgi:hypothetical protein